MRRRAPFSEFLAVGFLAMLAIGSAHAQAPTPPQSPTPPGDPFVRPPPGRGPQTPLAPAAPRVEIEALVRQGFEVKAVERASERNPSFLVILQRSGEVRTCLMRIERDQNRNPKRESVCF